jgi:hypothetical protein
MKKDKPIKKLQEILDGKLEGGFMVLASTNGLIIGGVEDPTNNCKVNCTTNNCNGGNCGNCIMGCGQLAA